MTPPPAASGVFANEFQGGSFVEVLAPNGSNPLASWKVTGPQKALQRVYDDKDVKGYIFASSGGTKLQIPKDDKATLGLVQPYLAFQVSLPLVCVWHGGEDATPMRAQLNPG